MHRHFFSLNAPTPEDVAVHKVSHLPCRVWCSLCKRCKTSSHPCRRTIGTQNPNTGPSTEIDDVVVCDEQRAEDSLLLLAVFTYPRQRNRQTCGTEVSRDQGFWRPCTECTIKHGHERVLRTKRKVVGCQRHNKLLGDSSTTVGRKFLPAE